MRSARAVLFATRWLVCALPPGERAEHAVYPLHAGKARSDLYKLLVFLDALALAAISFSGTVAYGRKLARRGPVRGEIP